VALKNGTSANGIVGGSVLAPLGAFLASLVPVTPLTR
jgi:hypothetical protein